MASVAFAATGRSHEPLFPFREDIAHGRSDSSALFHALQGAVASCGTPDRIAVGLGPGSYNGLRAGIAAARGFASALGIPLVALPSPLTVQGPDSGFLVAGDARGGRYWVASVEGNRFREEPVLLTPHETLSFLSSRKEIPLLGTIRLPLLGEMTFAFPDAGRLAILAEHAEPCSGTPEPLYLKPPHITTAPGVRCSGT